MFVSVRAFEMKLKLLRELLENVYFSSCDLLYNGESVSFPFPSVLHSMAENFQMRFADFHSHATNIRKASKVKHLAMKTYGSVEV
jgi:hypothetical protein